MKKWVIADVARKRAAQTLETASDSTGDSDSKNAIRAAQRENEILGAVRLLAARGAIRPRDPETGAPWDPASDFDSAHWLTREDLERVCHYDNTNEEGKAAYLEELTEWRLQWTVQPAAGR
jgi:hypothetical protein